MTIKAAYSELERNRWRNVEDELPEISDVYGHSSRVLIFDGHIPCIGRLFRNGKWSTPNSNNIWHSEIVTHWKHITEPEGVK